MYMHTCVLVIHMLFDPPSFPSRRSSIVQLHNQCVINSVTLAYIIRYNRMPRTFNHPFVCGNLCVNSWEYTNDLIFCDVTRLLLN
jgi:hypothetical protein